MLMDKIILSIEELLQLNEAMLGRGVPNQEDGIGYNKADYGACSNYFYGLSDSQVADLSKRLVKYSSTQLHIEKQIMKDTADYYKAKLTGSEPDRRDGVSVNVTDAGTLISFRYNPYFIDTIKSLPKRQFRPEEKQWTVPNENAIQALLELAKVGADVTNAVEYVKNHELCKSQKVGKVEVKAKYSGDFIELKFDYNPAIVNKIKELERKNRKWDAENKFWLVKKECLDLLEGTLDSVAYIKVV